jgi:DNA-binding HxlR family transcriptional regulator
MHHDPSLNQSTPATCPLRRTARLIGDMWTLLIIYNLMQGTKRFGELQDALGKVSPKTVSQRLKLLEQAGFVNRQAYAEIPPRVQYSLTKKGETLGDIINAMQAFGENYLTDEALPREIHADCQEALPSEDITACQGNTNL